MDTEPLVFVGIDWASTEHQVCLTGIGDPVQRAFAHDANGIGAMVDWLCAQAEQPNQVAVAIETPLGPIVEALMDRGIAVFAINPKHLDRFRDRFSPAGAKDDRRDALVLATSLRTDRHYFRRVEALDPAVVEVREWSRMAEDLKGERVRLANRVRQQLWRYYPQALDLAAAIYGVMWIWHHGAEAVQARLAEDLMSVEGLTARMVAQQTPRVAGTAVFLTRQELDVPPVLIWYLVRNRALHADLVVLTVSTAATPWIDGEERLSVKELAPHFWRAHARFGFMDRPDIPAVIDGMKQHGCGADMGDVTYYVGHSTIIPRDDGQGLPRWQEAIYAALERNATHVGDFLRLPQDCTVELGREVAI